MHFPGVFLIWGGVGRQTMARVWFAMADLPTSLESLQLVALAVLVDALLSPQNPRLLHCRTAVSLSLCEAETMLFGLHTASLGTPTSSLVPCRE